MSNNAADTLPCLSDGFRPFFLGAWVYAVVVMVLWLLQYSFAQRLGMTNIAPSQLHAHEMLFGYAMAVIVGFLLTAVRNWTGNTTIEGAALGGLFLLWVISRLGMWLPSVLPLETVVVASTLFYAGLMFVVLRSILRAGDQRQWLIIVLLGLLAATDLSFLLAAMGVLPKVWMSTALLLGLYLILGLIQLMAHRVVPFFIGRAIPEIQMPDSAYFKKHFLTTLAVYPVMVIADLFSFTALLLVSASILAVNAALVLRHFYHPKVWRLPLVWVLFLAYGFIVLGFIMKAASLVFGFMPSLATHLWAYGVIGLMTIGMTPRVALGHTGRVVLNPPKWMNRVLWPVFIMIVLGTLVRAVLPLFAMEHYSLWIEISQLLWIGAFGLLVVSYGPSLLQKRVD